MKETREDEQVGSVRRIVRRRIASVTCAAVLLTLAIVLLLRSLRVGAAAEMFVNVSVYPILFGDEKKQARAHSQLVHSDAFMQKFEETLQQDPLLRDIRLSDPRAFTVTPVISRFGQKLFVAGRTDSLERLLRMLALWKDAYRAEAAPYHAAYLEYLSEVEEPKEGKKKKNPSDFDVGPRFGNLVVFGPWKAAGPRVFLVFVWSFVMALGSFVLLDMARARALPRG